jgi:hypothetical protein
MADLGSGSKKMTLPMRACQVARKNVPFLLKHGFAASDILAAFAIITVAAVVGYSV